MGHGAERGAAMLAVELMKKAARAITKYFNYYLQGIS